MYYVLYDKGDNYYNYTWYHGIKGRTDVTEVITVQEPAILES